DVTRRVIVGVRAGRRAFERWRRGLGGRERAGDRVKGVAREDRRRAEITIRVARGWAGSSIGGARRRIRRWHGGGDEELVDAGGLEIRGNAEHQADEQRIIVLRERIDPHGAAKSERRATAPRAAGGA